jgi:hypothetical protein
MQKKPLDEQVRLEGKMRNAITDQSTDQNWEAQWNRYGFIEMLSDMRQVFPKQRVMQMFGWMVLFGATGGQTKDQMVKRLMKLGFGKSSVYDAAADIKRYQEFLWEKWGREVSQEQLARKVQQVQSELAEIVV